ncbi:hypothetical protein ACI2K4_25870 [Micromonospora sp. NPDC050397]|uniref:hypothetical protein n=1 Tax=Micromonospora sp. NPDC050397 TaxID=3364279 RepID=UPI003850FAD2
MGIRIKRAAGLLAAAVVATAGVGLGTQAAAQAAPPGYEFLTYYYWVEDCTRAGHAGVDEGRWQRFTCEDGSWFPGDDYELWVLYY